MAYPPSYSASVLGSFVGVATRIVGCRGTGGKNPNGIRFPGAIRRGEQGLSVQGAGRSRHLHRGGFRDRQPAAKQ